MQMLNALKIYFLKRRARRIHARILEIEETYDCGRTLRNHIIGGRQQRLEYEFQDIMAELRRIDPSAPRRTIR